MKRSLGSVSDIESADPPPLKKSKKTRKKKEQRTWNPYMEFSEHLEAKEFIKKEGIWSIKTRNKPKRNMDDDTKVTYRCNEVKKSAEQQCKAELLLHYLPKSGFVQCYKTPFEHDHSASDKSEKKPFTSAAKKIIIELYEMDEAKTKIQEELEKLGFNLSPLQLTNYLNRLKKKVRCGNCLKLGHPEESCILMVHPPENVSAQPPDQPTMDSQPTTDVQPQLITPPLIPPAAEPEIFQLLASTMEMQRTAVEHVHATTTPPVHTELGQLQAQPTLQAIFAQNQEILEAIRALTVALGRSSSFPENHASQVGNTAAP